MSIKDRGKIKWQGAFFMPEHVKMLSSLRNDYYKQDKPILDGYQIDDIENKIHEAMEFSNTLKIITWKDGFFKENVGLIHRLDGIEKRIYLETLDGYMINISFFDIVGAEIFDE
jgi:hypothetical protein